MVRGAERNAAVIADAEVDVLVIPAERYLANWFKPYTVDELPSAWRRWLAASEVQPSDPNACGRAPHGHGERPVVIPIHSALSVHRQAGNSPTSGPVSARQRRYADDYVCHGSRSAVWEPSSSGRRTEARPIADDSTAPRSRRHRKRRYRTAPANIGDTPPQTTLERIMVALRPDGLDQGAGSRRQVVYASAHSQRAPGHGADADCLLPWKASDRRVVVIVERAGSGMNVVVNGPRITELVIPKVAATRERVADYGVFIGTDVPDDRLAIPFYQGAVEEGHNLPFQYHQRATVRTARIHPRPSAVTWLERHTRLTQLFVGLGDAPFCLVLGTPNLDQPKSRIWDRWSPSSSRRRTVSSSTPAHGTTSRWPSIGR